jgi:transcriptional regulator with XRE-family HTH domain
MSFGQHMRTMQESIGLSRAELARRAKVPLSTLRGWEGDRGGPDLRALMRLAAALGVPVERFADGVDDAALAASEALEDAGALDLCTRHLVWPPAASWSPQL